MKMIEMTSVSSKGQVVIPKEIRKRLGIETGSKLAVITDGTNVLLKPVIIPRKELIERLLKEGKKWAREAGIKKSDVPKIIKRVRREHRS